MVILGIDPGTEIVGYGVINVQHQEHHILDVGVIRTSKKLPLSQRLEIIYREMTELINQHEPDEVAIEQLFFAKNVKTAMTVSQARGVLLLSCVHQQKPIFEYTPLQVKQGITGFGKASKEQVAKMVCHLLNIKEIPKPDDATDALAIAVCHANRMRNPWMEDLTQKSKT